MRAVLRHPLAIVSVFAAAVFGSLITWSTIPVELLPNLKLPRLIIRSSLSNASAEEVEVLLTRVVEEAVGTVMGVRSMNSVSSEGESIVVLRFNWGADMSLVAAEVREKLDLVADEFPKESHLPTVVHFDPTDAPIVTLALTGEEDPSKLRTLARDSIKTELETTSGVASVRLTGGLVPEVQVIADGGRLSAHSLDLRNLIWRIEKANINFPGGRVEQDSMEFSVRTVGRFKNLEDILALSVGRGVTGGIVKIRDVGDVRWGYREQTSISRVNGQPAVLLGIIKEQTANTIEVSQRVLSRIEDMRRKLGSAIRLEVVSNEAPFIRNALAGLRTDALIGMFLSFGVLWIGLRKFSSAILVGVSIPVSVVVTLGLMSVGGVSVNIMSIGGLALGVGMLVDCSIVVLECCHRRRPEYLTITDAAAASVGEVGWSLVSGTLTAMAVLIPIAFLSGLAQKLFRDFAFTVAVSHLISLFTALLFLPAVMVLTQSSAPSPVTARKKRPILEQGYQFTLSFCTRHPIVVVTLCCVAVGLSARSLSRLGLELLPDLATGQFKIAVTLPPDCGLQHLDDTVTKIEGWLKESPDVQGFVTEAGAEQGRTGLSQTAETGKSNEGQILVTLRPGSVAFSQPLLVADELRRRCETLPDAKVRFSFNQGPLARVLGSGQKPELLRLVGDDLHALVRLGNEVAEALRHNASLRDVDCDGSVWRKQLRVIVDRYQASSLGLSVEDVAEGVREALEGKVAGKFLQGDKEIDIRVQLRTKQIASVEELKQLPVAATRDDTVLLYQVANVKEDIGPREIYRADRRRNMVVHANVVGKSFSQGEEEAMAAVQSLRLPEGFEVQTGLDRVELKASMDSLALALGLATMLVYVIMVIQFESLVWPLVIFTSVPVSLVGPAIALGMTKGSINVQVLVGAVVLIGIVVNNAILVVATINDFRARGHSLLESVVEGSTIRLTPVLMTTFTSVLGALPICISTGEAAALNRPLALTVATGLISSTFFTLFLVPVVYHLVARLGVGRSAGANDSAG
jgi:hydrophobic/amphiphilic exporter-1 (mainly G- bacteria), HAE1 family